MFTLTSVTWTMPTAHANAATSVRPDPAALLKDLADVSLPAGIGKIRETYRGTSDKTVILIQDAHSIPDAQRSIQSAIAHFQKEYGITLVGLEGSSERLDPQIFRSFPDKELLRKTFDDYAQKGELTGGTAAALFNTRQNAVYQGMEDWELYEKGIASFLDATGDSDVAALLEQRVLELKREKEAIYPKELLKVDRLLAQFGENQTDIAEVLTGLSPYLPFPEGSELAVLLAEIRTDPKYEIEKKGIETEIKKIAEQVDSVLKSRSSSPELKQDLQMFYGKRQEYQTSQITPQAFALFLKDLAKQHKVKVKVSRELASLAEDQKKLRDIEGTRLFEDFKRYGEAVTEKLIGESGLATRDSIRQLNVRTQELALLKRLVKLELSFEDWTILKKTMGKPWTLDPELRAKLESHLRFYRIAEQRDGVFYNHLIDLIKKNESRGASPESRAANAAILVAGGFHTGGLTQAFKEKGISYILVMPRIGRFPEQSLYREHMQGDVSWKNYFEVKNGKVNLYDAFVRATRDKLLNTKNVTDPKLRVSSSVCKQWRDQIIRDLAEQGRIAEASAYTRFMDELNGPYTADIAQQLKEKWLANIDRFGDGLKKLQVAGKLSESGIAQLIKSITTAEPVLANVLVPAAEIKWPLSGQRSEIRGTDVEKLIKRIQEDLQDLRDPRGEIESLSPLTLSERELLLRYVLDKGKEETLWMRRVFMSHAAELLGRVENLEFLVPATHHPALAVRSWATESLEALTEKNDDGIKQSLLRYLPQLLRAWEKENNRENKKRLDYVLVYLGQKRVALKSVLADIAHGDRGALKLVKNLKWPEFVPALIRLDQDRSRDVVGSNGDILSLAASILAAHPDKERYALDQYSKGKANLGNLRQFRQWARQAHPGKVAVVDAERLGREQFLQLIKSLPDFKFEVTLATSFWAGKPRYFVMCGDAGTVGGFPWMTLQGAAALHSHPTDANRPQDIVSSGDKDMIQKNFLSRALLPRLFAIQRDIATSRSLEMAEYGLKEGGEEREAEIKGVYRGEQDIDRILEEVFQLSKISGRSEMRKVRSEIRDDYLRDPSKRHFLGLCLEAFAFSSVVGLPSAVFAQSSERTIFTAKDWRIIGATDSGPGAKPIQTPHGTFTEIKIVYKGDQIFSVKGNGYLRGVLPANYRGPQDERVDWGTSFVLPGYWSEGIYSHNPRITQAKFKSLEDGTVTLTGTLEDKKGNFRAKDFKMIFRKPLKESVEAEVSFTLKATRNFSIDAGRLANHEGLKVLQFSSMNIGSAHDADFAVYQGENEALVRSPTTGKNQFIVPQPQPLDQGLVYLTNEKPSSWGYRPTVFIQMLPASTPADFSAQGWIAESSNPNDDNLGVWVHYDGVKKTSYEKGKTIVRVQAVLGTTRPRLPLVAPSRSEVREPDSFKASWTAENFLKHEPSIWEQFKEMGLKNEPVIIDLEVDRPELVLRNLWDKIETLDDEQLVALSLVVHDPKRDWTHYVMIVDTVGNISRRALILNSLDLITIGQQEFLHYIIEDKKNHNIHLRNIAFGRGGVGAINPLRGKKLMKPVFERLEALLRENFEGWTISSYAVARSTRAALDRFNSVRPSDDVFMDYRSRGYEMLALSDDSGDVRIVPEAKSVFVVGRIERTPPITPEVDAARRSEMREDAAAEYAKVFKQWQDEEAFAELILRGESVKAAELIREAQQDGRTYYEAYQLQPRRAIYPGGLDLRILELFPNLETVHFINLKPFRVDYKVNKLAYKDPQGHSFKGQPALEKMLDRYLWMASAKPYISDELQQGILYPTAERATSREPQIGMEPFIKADLERIGASGIRIDPVTSDSPDANVFEIRFLDILGRPRTIYYHEMDFFSKSYAKILQDDLKDKRIDLLFVKGFNPGRQATESGYPQAFFEGLSPDALLARDHPVLSHLEGKEIGSGLLVVTNKQTRVYFDSIGSLGGVGSVWGSLGHSDGTGMPPYLDVFRQSSDPLAAQKLYDEAREMVRRNESLSLDAALRIVQRRMMDAAMEEPVTTVKSRSEVREGDETVRQVIPADARSAVSLEGLLKRVQELRDKKKSASLLRSWNSVKTEFSDMYSPRDLRVCEVLLSQPREVGIDGIWKIAGQELLFDRLSRSGVWNENVFKDKNSGEVLETIRRKIGSLAEVEFGQITGTLSNRIGSLLKRGFAVSGTFTLAGRSGGNVIGMRPKVRLKDIYLTEDKYGEAAFGGKNDKDKRTLILISEVSGFSLDATAEGPARGSRSEMRGEDRELEVRLNELKNKLVQLSGQDTLRKDVSPYKGESPEFKKRDADVNVAVSQGRVLEVYFTGINEQKDPVRDFLRSTYVISDSIQNEVQAIAPEFSGGRDLFICMFELLKNAFYHGNAQRLDLPVFIKINREDRSIEVIDLGIGDPAHPWPGATAGEIGITGAHSGVMMIKSNGWSYDIEPLPTDIEPFKAVVEGTVHVFLDKVERFQDFEKQMAEQGKKFLGTVVRISLDKKNAARSEMRPLPELDNKILLDDATGRIAFGSEPVVRLDLELWGVRHGITPANEVNEKLPPSERDKKGNFQGQVDEGIGEPGGFNQLTPQGKERAETAADILVEKFKDKIAAGEEIVIVMSPRNRAVETAMAFIRKFAAAGGKIKIVTNREIRAGADEMDFGFCDNKATDEITLPESRAFVQRYREGLDVTAHPGPVIAEDGRVLKKGESFLDLLVREKKFAERLNGMFRGRTVVVFGSGTQMGALRVILGEKQLEDKSGLINWRKSRLLNATPVRLSGPGLLSKGAATGERRSELRELSMRKHGVQLILGLASASAVAIGETLVQPGFSLSLKTTSLGKGRSESRVAPGMSISETPGEDQASLDKAWGVLEEDVRSKVGRVLEKIQRMSFDREKAERTLRAFVLGELSYYAATFGLIQSGMSDQDAAKLILDLLRDGKRDEVVDERKPRSIGERTELFAARENFFADKGRDALRKIQAALEKGDEKTAEGLLPSLKDPHTDYFTPLTGTLDQEIRSRLKNIRIGKGCTHQCLQCVLLSGHAVELLPFNRLLAVLENIRGTTGETAKAVAGRIPLSINGEEISFHRDSEIFDYYDPLYDADAADVIEAVLTLFPGQFISITTRGWYLGDKIGERAALKLVALMKRYPGQILVRVSVDLFDLRGDLSRYIVRQATILHTLRQSGQKVDLFISGTDANKTITEEAAKLIHQLSGDPFPESSHVNPISTVDVRFKGLRQEMDRNSPEYDPRNSGFGYTVFANGEVHFNPDIYGTRSTKIAFKIKDVSEKERFGEPITRLWSSSEVISGNGIRPGLNVRDPYDLVPRLFPEVFSLVDDKAPYYIRMSMAVSAKGPIQGEAGPVLKIGTERSEIRSPGPVDPAFRAKVMDSIGSKLRARKNGQDYQILILVGASGNGKTEIAKLLQSHGVGEYGPDDIAVMETDDYLGSWSHDTPYKLDLFQEDLEASLKKGKRLVIVSGVYTPNFLTGYEDHIVDVLLDSPAEQSRLRTLVRDGGIAPHKDTYRMFKNAFRSAYDLVLTDIPSFSPPLERSVTGSSFSFVSPEVYGKRLDEQSYGVSAKDMDRIIELIYREGERSGLITWIDPLSNVLSDIERLVRGIKETLVSMQSQGNGSVVMTVRSFEKGLEVILEGRKNDKADLSWGDTLSYMVDYIPERFFARKGWWVARTIDKPWERTSPKPEGGVLAAFGFPSARIDQSRFKNSYSVFSSSAAQRSESREVKPVIGSLSERELEDKITEIGTYNFPGRYEPIISWIKEEGNLYLPAGKLTEQDAIVDLGTSTGYGALDLHEAFPAPYIYAVDPKEGGVAIELHPSDKIITKRKIDHRLRGIDFVDKEGRPLKVKVIILFNVMQFYSPDEAAGIVKQSAEKLDEGGLYIVGVRYPVGRIKDFPVLKLMILQKVNGAMVPRELILRQFTDNGGMKLSDWTRFMSDESARVFGPRLAEIDKKIHSVRVTAFPSEAAASLFQENKPWFEHGIFQAQQRTLLEEGVQFRSFNFPNDLSGDGSQSEGAPIAISFDQPALRGDSLKPASRSETRDETLIKKIESIKVTGNNKTLYSFVFTRSEVNPRDEFLNGMDRVLHYFDIYRDGTRLVGWMALAPFPGIPEGLQGRRLILTDMHIENHEDRRQGIQSGFLRSLDPGTFLRFSPLTNSTALVEMSRAAVEQLKHLPERGAIVEQFEALLTGLPEGNDLDDKESLFVDLYPLLYRYQEITQQDSTLMSLKELFKKTFLGKAIGKAGFPIGRVWLEMHYEIAADDDFFQLQVEAQNEEPKGGNSIEEKRSEVRIRNVPRSAHMTTIAPFQDIQFKAGAEVGIRFQGAGLTKNFILERDRRGYLTVSAMQDEEILLRSLDVKPVVVKKDPSHRIYLLTSDESFGPEGLLFYLAKNNSGSVSLVNMGEGQLTLSGDFTPESGEQRSEARAEAERMPWWMALDVNDERAVESVYNEVFPDKQLATMKLEQFKRFLSVCRVVNPRGSLEDVFYPAFGGDVTNAIMAMEANEYFVLDLFTYDLQHFLEHWRSFRSQPEFPEAFREYINDKYRYGHINTNIFKDDGREDPKKFFNIHITRVEAVMIELESLGLSPDAVKVDRDTGKDLWYLSFDKTFQGAARNYKFYFLPPSDITDPRSYSPQLLALIQKKVGAYFEHAVMTLASMRGRYVDLIWNVVKEDGYIVGDDLDDVLRIGPYGLGLLMEKRGAEVVLRGPVLDPADLKDRNKRDRFFAEYYGKWKLVAHKLGTGAATASIRSETRTAPTRQETTDGRISTGFHFETFVLNAMTGKEVPIRTRILSMAAAPAFYQGFPYELPESSEQVDDGIAVLENASGSKDGMIEGHFMFLVEQSGKQFFLEIGNVRVEDENRRISGKGRELKYVGTRLIQLGVRLSQSDARTRGALRFTSRKGDRDAELFYDTLRPYGLKKSPAKNGIRWSLGAEDAAGFVQGVDSFMRNKEGEVLSRLPIGQSPVLSQATVRSETRFKTGPASVRTGTGKADAEEQAKRFQDLTDPAKRRARGIKTLIVSIGSGYGELEAKLAEDREMGVVAVDRYDPQSEIYGKYGQMFEAGTLPVQAAARQPGRENIAVVRGNFPDFLERIPDHSIDELLFVYPEDDIYVGLFDYWDFILRKLVPGTGTIIVKPHENLWRMTPPDSSLFKEHFQPQAGLIWHGINIDKYSQFPTGSPVFTLKHSVENGQRSTLPQKSQPAFARSEIRTDRDRLVAEATKLYGTVKGGTAEDDIAFSKKVEAFARERGGEAFSKFADMVTWNGQGLLLTGESYAGKSRLAYFLHHNGMKYAGSDNIELMQFGSDLIGGVGARSKFMSLKFRSKDSFRKDMPAWKEEIMPEAAFFPVTGIVSTVVDPAVKEPQVTAFHSLKEMKRAVDPDQGLKLIEDTFEPVLLLEIRRPPAGISDSQLDRLSKEIFDFFQYVKLIRDFYKLMKEHGRSITGAMSADELLEKLDLTQAKEYEQDGIRLTVFPFIDAPLEYQVIVRNENGTIIGNGVYRLPKNSHVGLLFHIFSEHRAGGYGGKLVKAILSMTDRSDDGVPTEEWRFPIPILRTGDVFEEASARSLIPFLIKNGFRPEGLEDATEVEKVLNGQQLSDLVLQMLAGYVFVKKRPVIREEPAAAQTLKGRVILHVDNDPTDRANVRGSLEKTGAEVLSVADGKTALEILARRNVDAVVTDANMPEISGAELVRKVQTIKPEIPIVMATRENVDDRNDLAHQLGVTVIRKNQVVETLSKLLKPVVSQRSEIRVSQTQFVPPVVGKLANVLEPSRNGTVLDAAEVLTVYELAREDLPALIRALKTAAEEQMAQRSAQAGQLYARIKEYQDGIFRKWAAEPADSQEAGISVALMMDGKTNQPFLSRFAQVLKTYAGRRKVELIADSTLLNAPELRASAGLYKEHPLDPKSVKGALTVLGSNAQVPLGFDAKEEKAAISMVDFGFRPLSVAFKADNTPDGVLMQDHLELIFAVTLLHMAELIAERRKEDGPVTAAWLKAQLEAFFGIGGMFQANADGSLSILGAVVQQYLAQSAVGKAA